MNQLVSSEFSKHQVKKEEKKQHKKWRNSTQKCENKIRTPHCHQQTNTPRPVVTLELSVLVKQALRQPPCSQWRHGVTSCRKQAASLRRHRRRRALWSVGVPRQPVCSAWCQHFLLVSLPFPHRKWRQKWAGPLRFKERRPDNAQTHTLTQTWADLVSETTRAL